MPKTPKRPKTSKNGQSRPKQPKCPKRPKPTKNRQKRKSAVVTIKSIIWHKTLLRGRRRETGDRRCQRKRQRRTLSKRKPSWLWPHVQRSPRTSQRVWRFPLCEKSYSGKKILGLWRWSCGGFCHKMSRATWWGGSSWTRGFKIVLTVVSIGRTRRWSRVAKSTKNFPKDPCTHGCVRRLG